jgi:hypothetical protein
VAAPAVTTTDGVTTTWMVESPPGRSCFHASVNAGGVGAGFGGAGGAPDRLGVVVPGVAGVVCGVVVADDAGVEGAAGVVDVELSGTDCPGIVDARAIRGSAIPMARTRPLYLVYHGWATRL